MIRRSRMIMIMGLGGSLALGLACKSDSHDPPPAGDSTTTGPAATSTGMVDDTGTTGTTGDPLDAILERLAVPCDDPLASVYAATTPAPWSPELRGSIAGCAYDREVSVDEMSAHFAAHPELPDPGLATAAHKLVLSYWTEREPGQPVLTSAALYVPEQLRADPSPLLVLGHGSVGIGDRCAPSREDEEGFDKDWKALAYPFAGDGWMVIMPDFPGLGTEGPGTWMHSLDEGHAILDATRAARRLFEPGTLTDRNALVGLSNGGHATLSAQAMLGEYGAEGEVVANVLYSPFWLSNAAWGALISPVGESLLNPTFMSMTLQYFYGHGYAYDGPDGALAPLLPTQADAVAELLENECWGDVTGEALGPPSLGILIGEDAFTEAMVDEVGSCAVLEDCDTPLALAWRERWVADRPTPSPAVPIVYWMGGADDFLSPGFQQCGIDRLVANGADLTLCVDVDSGHSEVTTRTAGWVRQYLESVLLGGPAPEACTGVEALGRPLTCTLPIVNSTDPGDP